MQNVVSCRNLDITHQVCRYMGFQKGVRFVLRSPALNFPFLINKVGMIAFEIL